MYMHVYRKLGERVLYGSPDREVVFHVRFLFKEVVLHVRVVHDMHATLRALSGGGRGLRRARVRSSGARFPPGSVPVGVPSGFPAGVPAVARMVSRPVSRPLLLPTRTLHIVGRQGMCAGTICCYIRVQGVRVRA